MNFYQISRDLILLFGVLKGFLDIFFSKTKMVVKNMKFNHDQPVNVFGIKDKFYKGKIVNTNMDIVVRVVCVKNKKESKNAERDLNQTFKLQKRNTRYVLKIATHAYENDKLHIGYGFYDCTLRNYFELQQVREKTFKSLLLKIITRVGFLHSKNVVLNNISPDNIVIEYKNCNAVLNFMNFSKSSIRNSNNYTKDFKDLGYLLISLITGEKDLPDILKKLKRRKSYNKKFNFLLQAFAETQWIPSNKIKLFTDLILCLIKVRTKNNNLMKKFKEHVFFWKDEEIEKFINIISSRIDLNDKLKNKAEIRKRIEQINNELPYKWIDKLDEKVKKLVPKNCEDNLSSMIKFIRNRIIHQDDDTDHELKDSMDEMDENSNTSRNKILNKNAVEISQFFKSQNGVVNYFLITYDDLLYDLYNYFRQHYSTHKKLMKYYPEYFIINDETASSKTINSITADQSNCNPRQSTVSTLNNQAFETPLCNQRNISKNKDNPEVKQKNHNESSAYPKNKNLQNSGKTESFQKTNDTNLPKVTRFSARLNKNQIEKTKVNKQFPAAMNLQALVITSSDSETNSLTNKSGKYKRNKENAKSN